MFLKQMTAMNCVYHDLANRLRNSEDVWVTFKEVIYDKDVVMPESVRRIRQKFQESGKYLGKKRVQRLEEAKSVRKWSLVNKF